MSSLNASLSFQYQYFIDYCEKYSAERDSLRLHLPEAADAPRPSCEITYSQYLRDTLTFTMQAVSRECLNSSIRLEWALRSGDIVLDNGLEKVRETHTISVDIPSDITCLTLTMRLLADTGSSTAYSDVVVTGLANRIEPDTGWWFSPPEHSDLSERGEDDFKQMVKILSAHDIPLNSLVRIFEFGCSNGRMLRHFIPYADRLSLWGSDKRTDQIQWAMENLPKLNLITHGDVPHLPFADGFFSFIYAGSSFTRLTDTHTAWLAEFARVTKTNGYAYLTFFDGNAAQRMIDAYHGKIDRYYSDFEYLMKNSHIRTKLERQDFSFFSVRNGDREPDVFMSRQYIEQITGNFFRLIAAVPCAYSDLQTAYLLKRK